MVEPDPTYELAATPRGTGGIRQLFSRPENILMGQFGLDFYKAFHETMAVDGEPAPVDFRQGGYLFIENAKGAARLEADHRTQTGLGARVDLLDAAGVAARFPSIRTDDIAVAAHSPDDGWIDPHAALMGFRRKARSLGAEYVQDRVAGLEADGVAVRAAVLQSGGRIAGDAFVNACGAWAGQVAAMIGMPLPIEPMRRYQHYFECHAEIEPLPLIKDFDTLGVRPEGKGWLGGKVDWSMKPGFNFDVDPDWFDAAVWPALAYRVPAWEAIREKRNWAGHYARNTLDGNMILGRWEGGLENMVVVGGFSGHGIMQAPAAGRGVAELLLDGGFRTLDLSAMSWRRVPENRPYAELGIK